MSVCVCVCASNCVWVTEKSRAESERQYVNVPWSICWCLRVHVQLGSAAVM